MKLLAVGPLVIPIIIGGIVVGVIIIGASWIYKKYTEYQAKKAQ